MRFFINKMNRKDYNNIWIMFIQPFFFFFVTEKVKFYFPSFSLHLWIICTDQICFFINKLNLKDCNNIWIMLHLLGHLTQLVLKSSLRLNNRLWRRRPLSSTWTAVGSLLKNFRVWHLLWTIQHQSNRSLFGNSPTVEKKIDSDNWRWTVMSVLDCTH